MLFRSIGENIAMGFNAVIRLYDMKQGEQGTMEVGDLLRSLHFSPDSKLLAAGGWQGTKLWDVENLKVVDNIAVDRMVDYTQFSPDGRFLVYADVNKVIIWDIIAQRKIETSDEYMGYVQSVAISSDSRWLACAENYSVKLWDLETHELLSIFETKRFGAPPVGFLPYSVAISPDNSLLAAGSWNHNNVMIWDIEDNEEFAIINAEAPGLPYVYAIAFSPDGELLAFGGSGGLQLWDIGTKKEIELNGNAGFVYSMAFSPDSKFLISGGTEEVVHIWDIEKQKKTDELQQESIVYSLSYSPNGRWLAVGLHANKVELWDMQWLKGVATFATDSPVDSVVFNNNGCLLAVLTWRAGMTL